jgi:CRP/FNR family transcriptional regulator, cyclic AMP receptor protein
VLATTDKMPFLKRVPLFAKMSLEQIRVLTSHLEEQHFLPGEAIIYEGEFSQELYILMSGRVRIAKDYGGLHERTLAVLTQGDFFGEMAIFESALRSATAVAAEESELLALSPEKFKQTIYQKPEMVFEMFRELSARLRGREDRAASAHVQEGGTHGT